MRVETIALPGGDSRLRDERKKIDWSVALAAFRIAKHPVTRGQYAAVVDAAIGQGDPHEPATDVSWLDAVAFCNRLSARAGLAACYRIGGDPEGRDVTCDWHADGYRLPSEAEWEYACRAGTTSVRYGDLDAIAWYQGNAAGRVHPVAGKAPNAWGIYDTIGNVWEWCWDVYDAAVYGPYRVFRGGGWADPPRGCRASCRRKSHPTYRIDDVGFRVVRSGAGQ